MSESDLSYCCGSCAYPLNLASSNQIAAGVGSEYDKDLKKGFATFFSVDVSRFTQVDEVTCFPVYWGRNHLKTKFLCRKCGAHIGFGYRESPVLCGFHSPNSCRSSYIKFTMKILAIQPSGTANSLTINALGS